MYTQGRVDGDLETAWLRVRRRILAMYGHMEWVISTMSRREKYM